MEPENLTVKVLLEIRDEIRGLREEQRAQGDRLDTFMRDTRTRFDLVDKRFEAVETTLRDLSQQLVLLARGIKVALKQRKRTEQKFEDHERRIGALEKRSDR